MRIVTRQNRRNCTQAVICRVCKLWHCFTCPCSSSIIFFHCGSCHVQSIFEFTAQNIFIYYVNVVLLLANSDTQTPSKLSPLLTVSNTSTHFLSIVIWASAIYHFVYLIQYHQQTSYPYTPSVHTNYKYMITMSYHANTTWALSTNGNKAQR